VAHSVTEIEGQLGTLWVRAAKARAEAARVEAAPVAATDGIPGTADTDLEVRHVAARTSVLNLVVVAGDELAARHCAATIAGTAGHHPSRSLILSEVDKRGPAGLEARVEALSLSLAPGDGRTETGAETVYVTTHGETGRHLASIIVPLLVHDLPVALWWPSDPPFDSHRSERLLPLADLLIVDGSSWSGDGLDRLARMAALAAERGTVVADWALLRQARWREALASVYDLPDLRPHLRAVRRIQVEYSAAEPGDSSGQTNVVRPLSHVAWLASRLGMTVVTPLHRDGDGSRVATLRQGDHAVEIALKPGSSTLGAGSTIRVEITSQLRGATVIGSVAAGDRTVEVSILHNGRERVRRSYAAPRLTEVELLGRAIEGGAPDPVAVDALAMGLQLLRGPSGRKS
jgi:glucose-6-phosphate dehydrogenase assembly protein OpcA